MIRFLTILILTGCLDASAQGLLQRWIPSTSQFSREAVTNINALGWRTKLGIGSGTNPVVYDLISSSNLLYSGLSPDAQTGITNAGTYTNNNDVVAKITGRGIGTNTSTLAKLTDVNAATNAFRINRYTTNADNVVINGANLTNAVDLVGSSTISVTPNATHRSWTINTLQLQLNRWTTNSDSTVLNGNTLTNAVDLVAAGLIKVTPDATHRTWTIGTDTNILTEITNKLWTHEWVDTSWSERTNVLTCRVTNGGIYTINVSYETQLEGGAGDTDSTSAVSVTWETSRGTNYTHQFPIAFHTYFNPGAESAPAPYIISVKPDSVITITNYAQNSVEIGGDTPSTNFTHVSIWGRQ